MDRVEAQQIFGRNNKSLPEAKPLLRYIHILHTRTQAVAAAAAGRGRSNNAHALPEDAGPQVIPGCTACETVAFFPAHHHQKHQRFQTSSALQTTHTHQLKTRKPRKHELTFCHSTAGALPRAQRHLHLLSPTLTSPTSPSPSPNPQTTPLPHTRNQQNHDLQVLYRPVLRHPG